MTTLKEIGNLEGRTEQKMLRRMHWIVRSTVLEKKVVRFGLMIVKMVGVIFILEVGRTTKNFPMEVNSRRTCI